MVYVIFRRNNRFLLYVLYYNKEKLLYASRVNHTPVRPAASNSLSLCETTTYFNEKTNMARKVRYSIFKGYQRKPSKILSN